MIVLLRAHGIRDSSVYRKRRGRSDRTCKRFRRDTSGLTLLPEKVLGMHDIGVDPMVNQKILKAPQFRIESRRPKQPFF